MESWPNYRVLKRHSIPCILDLDFLSFTPHIILRSGVGTKWLLFFQSRRSFTLMSFTSNLTVLCFCYSGPAQPFIVTLFLVIVYVFWKSGGFAEGLPVEMLQLLERPLHRLARMELLLTRCMKRCARCISLQFLIKGVKTGLMLPSLPGILRCY